MENLVEFLNRPIPFDWSKRWLIVAIPTVWIFFLMLLLRPLGLAIHPKKIEAILIITLITAVSCFIVMYIFPFFFRKFYAPGTWKRYKLIVIGCVIPALIMPAIAFYVKLTLPNPLMDTFQGRLLLLMPVGLFISIFPTIIIDILLRNLHTAKEAPGNTAGLVNGRDLLPDEESIIILSNTKESLTINPHTFIYAEVQGNYVTLFYMKGENVEQKSLRITLSQIIDVFDKYPDVVRCHRAFLVNMQYIIDIYSSSQAHSLTLKNIKPEIPVSRSYIKDLRKAVKEN